MRFEVWRDVLERSIANVNRRKGVSAMPMKVEQTRDGRAISAEFVGPNGRVSEFRVNETELAGDLGDVLMLLKRRSSKAIAAVRNKDAA